MNYVEHDPNEYNPGCFSWFIWFGVAIISFCMAFVHPLAALVVFIIGISIAAQVARLSNTQEAYERMQERMSTCSRARRQQQPAEIVYRREVTVSETIYQNQNFRPRREFDPAKLQGVFRNLE
jgi:hypothetical protein